MLFSKYLTYEIFFTNDLCDQIKLFVTKQIKIIFSNQEKILIQSFITLQNIKIFYRFDPAIAAFTMNFFDIEVHCCYFNECIEPVDQIIRYEKY